MLRAPVSAANSLLRSSDSAALPGNATVRRLSPCKNPPRSPPTLHPALAVCSGGTRALRCAGMWWWVRCWRSEKGGNTSRCFYSFGGEILFPAFTHLVEGGLLLSFSFIGQRNLSSLLHSFGRGRFSAFVFFHWVEESFFPASHIW